MSVERSLRRTREWGIALTMSTGYRGESRIEITAILIRWIARLRWSRGDAK